MTAISTTTTTITTTNTAVNTLSHYHTPTPFLTLYNTTPNLQQKLRLMGARLRPDPGVEVTWLDPLPGTNDPMLTTTPRPTFHHTLPFSLRFPHPH
ncbi:hypothetical protein E2C01_038788 [Portunus trituberculatus]|uniref:Uncharacterized protein n=1 Tax=Portunus trituberculatus TaxID=210409 RepID=A0A5B7FIZ0_PORTR|nr:hypothetical protein [Portunus trituberculatus]